MQVGLLVVFQNFQDGTSDQAAWERDIRLAGLAEPLGFDTLSAVEHRCGSWSLRSLSRQGSSALHCQKRSAARTPRLRDASLGRASALSGSRLDPARQRGDAGVPRYRAAHAALIAGFIFLEANDADLSTCGVEAATARIA
jgi:hypothetical protein